MYFGALSMCISDYTVKLPSQRKLTNLFSHRIVIQQVIFVYCNTWFNLVNVLQPFLHVFSGLDR
jgi:Zn-finger domain-containing protein